MPICRAMNPIILKTSLTHATAALVVMFLFLKGAAMPASAATAHDFSFPSIDGGTIALADYRGKVVLLVNTASKCGFTGQYKGLQSLWTRYRDAGLVVLGVPSDDFGGQELDSAGAVKEFCEMTYGIDFPMTDIVRVKGAAAHPYYQWVAANYGGLAVPRWNFHKHLIGPDGWLADWFMSTTGADSRKIEQAIEKALATVAAK